MYTSNYHKLEGEIIKNKYYVLKLVIKLLDQLHYSNTGPLYLLG